MSRIRTALSFVLLLGLSLGAARAAEPAPLAKIELADGDAFVFVGDSITHQCLYTQYVEDYFYTRFPKMRIEFHNAGVGGDRAADALRRFDRDVAQYKPKYVTVLLGMNDGTYQPFDRATFDTYQAGMRELVERVEALGAKPILMSPTMFDSRASRARKNGRPRSEEMLAEYNAVLAYYGAWLREVAYNNGYGFVDMYSPLNNLTLESRKSDAAFTMIPDSVHPAAAGQLVMAYSILADMNVPTLVSSVTVSRGSDGNAETRALGGTISDARFTSDGLQFTFTANSLPLVMPEEANVGVDLVKLGHRMSREPIEVHGLPAGRYRLTIDGTDVGTFTEAQLARHVELQANAKTPQYQQALAVAELNRERNAGPVHDLRNLWSSVKRLRVAKAALKASPEDETLKKTIATHSKNVMNLEEKIAAAEAAAKEIEDRIFEVNQPKTRRYELTRIGN